MSNSFSPPWTVTHQAPLSMQFLRQEYCYKLPFPSPGDLSNIGIEPEFPALKADSLPLSKQGSPINSEFTYKKAMTKETSDLLYTPERPLGRAAVLPCLKDTHYPHLEGTKKLDICKLPESCLFQRCQHLSGSPAQLLERYLAPCTIKWLHNFLLRN